MSAATDDHGALNAQADSSAGGNCRGDGSLQGSSIARIRGSWVSVSIEPETIVPGVHFTVRTICEQEPAIAVEYPDRGGQQVQRSEDGCVFVAKPSQSLMR